MLKEPLPPQILCSYEKWFSEKISFPLEDLERLVDHDGAASFLLPSSTLSPEKRIEIYAQQYWWRLVDCLSCNFSSLCTFLGLSDFNKEIAIPYLTENPPFHWSLNTLGASLPIWIKKKKFPLLWLHLAQADLGALKVFFARQLNEPKTEGEKVLASCSYCLQPYVFLLKTPFPLMPYRDALLAKKPLPSLEKKKNTYYYSLFRGRNFYVTWNEIDKMQYNALQKFSFPRTLEEFCQELEKESLLAKEAEEKIAFWFQNWTAFGWLAIHR